MCFVLFIHFIVGLFGIKNNPVCSSVYNIPAEYTLNVDYMSKYLIKGNELFEYETIIEPKLSWNNININKCYTIIMVDPDSPSSINPSESQWLHWFVSNQIRNDNNTILNEGNIKKGYLNPHPLLNTGYHRYCLYVFEQHECNRKYSNELENKLINQRNNYNLMNELIDYNNDILISDNYFIMRTTESPTNTPTNNPTIYNISNNNIDNDIINNIDYSDNNNKGSILNILTGIKPSNTIIISIVGLVCVLCGLTICLCISIKRLKREQTGDNKEITSPKPSIPNQHYKPGTIQENFESLPYKFKDPPKSIDDMRSITSNDIRSLVINDDDDNDLNDNNNININIRSKKTKQGTYYASANNNISSNNETDL